MGGAQPLAGTHGRRGHSLRRDRSRSASPSAWRTAISSTAPAISTTRWRMIEAAQARTPRRFDRRSRQRRRHLSRNIARARHHPRRRYRPDLGARSRLRLCARRAAASPKCGACASTIRDALMQESRASIVAPRPRDARLQSARRGRVRQRQSDPHAGARRRRCATPSTSRSSPKLICGRCSPRAIGPFRWISLVQRSRRHPQDRRLPARDVSATIASSPTGSRWRAQHVPFEGLPARIAWLGHGERTALALAVNRMVRDGTLSGPVAFTRDHLDAGAMAHPNIMTERMRDGSDAIADWPLLDAMAMCSSQADLVAIHSGGGGYSGYMTSAGVTVIADGTGEAEERLSLVADQRHQPRRDALRRRRLSRSARRGQRQGPQSLPIVLSSAGAHDVSPTIDWFQVVRWTTLPAGMRKTIGAEAAANSSAVDARVHGRAGSSRAADVDQRSP